MGFCKKCGNQLREGANFCPKCGTAVGNNNAAAFSETQTTSPRKRKKKGIKYWVLLAILIIGGTFLGTRYFALTLHCKLFGWIPYYETPSIVTYNFLRSVLIGDIDEAKGYCVTENYPSRALMKENKDKYLFETLDSIHNDADRWDVFHVTILSEDVQGSHAKVEYEYTIRFRHIEFQRVLPLVKDKDGAWAIESKSLVNIY